MRLMLSIAAVGLMFSTPVFGQPACSGISIVDGLKGSWRSYGASPSGSVRPTQVSAIDLQKFDYDFGPYYPSWDEFQKNCLNAEGMYPGWDRMSGGYSITLIHPRADWQFYIAFDVTGSLFAGDPESSYELFFDVYPERDHGGVIGPWHTFRPDYRFAFTGRNGQMERERYQVWNGTQWVGEPVADAPEVVAAAGDNVFECLIPWSSLGNPLTRSPRSKADPEANPLFISFALRTHQGENQDFIPNPVYSKNWPASGAIKIRHSRVFYLYETGIAPRSWGQLKAGQNRD